MSKQGFFIDDNSNQVSVSEGYINRIESENTRKNNTIKELNDDIYEKKEIIERLTNELNVFGKRYDNCKSDAESLFRENQKIKEEIDSQKNIIDDISMKNNILNNDLIREKELAKNYRNESIKSNERLRKILMSSRKEKIAKLFKYFLVAYVILLVILGVYALGSFILINPIIFRVTEETISFITNFYNILILFLIPMFFGALSAFARLCFSDISLIKGKGIKLIFASGLMAAFSWVGVKSKLFVALLIPYLEAKPSIGEAIKNIDITEFYSMVLVSIIVGMFASNLFVFIDNKAKMLKLESKVNANSTADIDKNNTKNSENFPN